MAQPLLKVVDLKTYFFLSRGTLKAVDGASISIDRGETVGLVGESGCGKSALALSILRLIQNPPGRIVGGNVIFEGKDLLKISAQEIRAIRGGKISMIFQDPTASLNPVFTIGDQISEAARIHLNLDKRAALKKAAETLSQVGVPSPNERLGQYPFELSGGMRQRVMIAMAIVSNPLLLIADEPTTNLDVTMQAQILDLINNLKIQRNSSVLLITHDLSVVAETCDRVIVMYAGEVVEDTKVSEFFTNPKHPYSQGLLACVEGMDSMTSKIPFIPGSVPDLISPIEGCKFTVRCPYAFDKCKKNKPMLREIGQDHRVACHLYS